MATEAADTAARALEDAARVLAEAGIDGARHEARLLLGHATGLPAARLVAGPDRPVDSTALAHFEALVARRARREPVSHLTGVREFWSLGFAVESSVLDPRADSETLVDAALAHCPGRDAAIRILDLGTGSGCLLLSVLHERPFATGIGVDLSAAALDVAARNAARLGLADRACFVRGDWGAALAGTFDLVLCNPPYVASADIDALSPEVARYEPRVALDGGADGLGAYRRVLAGLPSLLTRDGVAVIEMGVGQDGEIATIAADSGLRVREIRHDLGGIARCAVIGLKRTFTIT